jgi:hypothetical protein
MVPAPQDKDDPMTKLSDTQAILLTAAAQRADGNLLPLPGSLRGGAATKVVGALLARGLARVEPPAGVRPVEMDGARALAARRASGEIGAAQRPAVPRQARLGIEAGQPVRGGGREAVSDRVQVEARRWRPDVVEIDHLVAASQARMTRPRSARVMAV